MIIFISMTNILLQDFLLLSIRLMATRWPFLSRLGRWLSPSYHICISVDNAVRRCGDSFPLRHWGIEICSARYHISDRSSAFKLAFLAPLLSKVGVRPKKKKKKKDWHFDVILVGHRKRLAYPLESNEFSIGKYINDQGNVSPSGCDTSLLFSGCLIHNAIEVAA